MNQETHQEPHPEETPRRRFLKQATWLLGSIAAAALAVPVVWNMVGAVYRRTVVRYSSVIKVSALPQGRPVTVTFQYRTEEAYLRQEETHDVWVIKHSPTDITVFSSICPHLGCHYDWDATAQRFICPCHASAFAPDGTVLAGPAPRPLDTLPYRVEDDQLLVAWERFAPGIPRKIPV